MSQRHTRLDELWAVQQRQRTIGIFAAETAERRLAILESLLVDRIPVVRSVHPAVAEALVQFEALENVRRVVKDSGYSHRHLIALFRRATGLAPKVYCRVQRLRQALTHATVQRDVPWAAIAMQAGYSDQAHFCREFLQFAGVTPTDYRNIAPIFPYHVPLPHGRR